MKFTLYQLNNSMNSFRDLQTIYEGYRGHSAQPPPKSNIYPAETGNHTYQSPLPGQTPGSQGPITSTIPLHSSDEEVSLGDVITDLINKSRDEGINPKYLIELLSFIK
jgi:hypothetical protein